MSLILNIDTSGERASLCLAKGKEILEIASQDNPKDHASWLHQAILDALRNHELTPNQLSAVAVSIGPGSYTGLRVGLATAKGLCYALKIPLITVGTLEMMANSVRTEATDLICPMIDARRMEVFTAIYDINLVEQFAPIAMILETNSFGSWLAEREILFCGNGVTKLGSLNSNPNAKISQQLSDARHLSPLSVEKYHQRRFADLAYSEPLYLKEFHFPN